MFCGSVSQPLWLLEMHDQSLNMPGGILLFRNFIANDPSGNAWPTRIRPWVISLVMDMS